MVVTAEVGAKQLSELLKEVQAGNEVLLTQNKKPVARLVPAGTTPAGSGAPLRVRSLKGHEVLALNVSQAEISDEMFGSR